MLKDSLAPTNKMIKNLIEVELGYINIDNVEFQEGMAQQVSKLIQEKEEKEKKQEIKEYVCITILYNLSRR